MAFERILIAVGPDDRGDLDPLVDTAVELAESMDAEIYFFYHFSEGEYDNLRAQMDFETPVSNIGPDEIAARHESIEEPASLLDSKGIEYKIRGAVGGIMSEQIVKFVESQDIGMVIVGGKKRSPAGKAMFGDNAQKIILNAPCPVLFTKRT